MNCISMQNWLKNTKICMICLFSPNEHNQNKQKKKKLAPENDLLLTTRIHDYK